MEELLLAWLCLLTDAEGIHLNLSLPFWRHDTHARRQGLPHLLRTLLFPILVRDVLNIMYGQYVCAYTFVCALINTLKARCMTLAGVVMLTLGSEKPLRGGQPIALIRQDKHKRPAHKSWLVQISWSDRKKGLNRIGRFADSEASFVHARAWEIEIGPIQCTRSREALKTTWKKSGRTCTHNVHIHVHARTRRRQTHTKAGIQSIHTVNSAFEVKCRHPPKNIKTCNILDKHS